VIALADIRAVSGAVYRVAQVTPCLHSHALSEDFGAAVYLKAECLQRTGSFKVRGAAARISRLSAEELARGVVTASAGNHAQGVAIAARQAGIAATVVMPVNAALAKVQATRAYGATVLLHGDDFAEASAEAARLARDHGLTMVPAFDDEAVIAGQGTVGLEIAEQCPQAALALVPRGRRGAHLRRRCLPEVPQAGHPHRRRPGGRRPCGAARIPVRSRQAVPSTSDAGRRRGGVAAGAADPAPHAPSCR
jgi:threonine dehydratase